MAKGSAQAAADERVLDFIQLYLGYRASAQAGVPESHMVAGWAIARSLDNTFQEALTEFIAPYLDDPGAAVWIPLYRKALVGAPSPERVDHYADWSEAFLLWARRNPKVWQDAWDSVKSKRKALQIHDVTQEDEPASQVRKLAAIPSISGMIRIRKWLEGATGQLGQPLSAVESVGADAQTVRGLTSKLNNVQTALEASVPMSEDHAHLQEQKAELNRQVKAVVDSSADSAAVLAAAVSSQTTSAVAAKARLNDEQVRAMLAEGNVLITAGAGAGKTAVMAAKVAYHVLEQGMSPDQVLAVSFTRKAATELKERVEKLYGIQSDTISTTHTLAGNVLREFHPGARAVLAKTSPRNSDKLMRLAFAQIALSERGSSSGYGYGGRGGWRGRKAAYGAAGGNPYWKEPAGQWFNLGVTPADEGGKPIGRNALSAVVEVAQSHSETWQDIKAKSDQNPRNSLLRFGAAFYAAYEWLKENDPELSPYRDFNDWLGDAADLMENNPQALASMQRRFKVVLVDEAQDLNKQQQRLFNAIAAKAKVYAQIGDDRQSIYKFRGAVPELFTELPKKGFDTYNLTFNYRSGKNIVDAAERLISHNGDRQIPKTCRANPSRVEDGLVEMIRPDSHEAGAVQVSEEIANSCSPDAGGSPANFGILVRNNAEADAYAIALMAKGIPFRSRTSYFDKPAVKALLSWCQLAVSKDPNVINAATLKAHMRPGFFLGDKFMEGLQQYCPRGKNYAEYIIEGGTAYMSGYNAKNIALYADEIHKLQKFQGSASDLINAVLGVTGSKGISFRDALAEDVDPEELMEGTDKLEVSKEEIAEAATAPINPLIRMAQKFEDPEKWLAFVDRMVKANDKTLKKEEDATPAVRIDTVHSWKGLQAKHVYVVMAGGGVFPSSHAMNAEADGVNTALDEERRLAYVAITRGEDAVTVICPAKNYHNKDADVPMFVAEACVKPRKGFVQSVGKTANWTVALESAVDDFLGSSADESSLEEIWGDVL